MATLVLSDLHLGAVLGGDVLRLPHVREHLMREVAGADRVVLLGDTLELREQPLAGVLAAARPFFEELGEALDGGAVTIVPGNHDHQLAAPLIEARRLRGRRLGLTETAKPGSSGPLAAIARRMPRSELTVAYPGTWLRDDVYALHGHYLDCHVTVPRAEVLGIAATRRLLRRDVGRASEPDDYEALIGPLYAFVYQLAHAAEAGRAPGSSTISARVWTRLNGRRPTLGSRAAATVGVPAVIAALNRLGLGPFTADLSGPSLRRAGLEAMHAVLERLGVEAEHVLFGHTHRAGPLPSDDGGDWGRLVNAGSWVYEPALLGEVGPSSPYWPGTCVLVGEGGAPEIANALRDVPGARLEG